MNTDQFTAIECRPNASISVQNFRGNFFHWNRICTGGNVGSAFIKIVKASGHPAACFRWSRLLLLVCLLFVAASAWAQPYETNIASLTWNENFDELGTNTVTLAPPPYGWVLAQGQFLPIYDNPLTTSPDICVFSSGTPLDFTGVGTPLNSQCFTRLSDGINNPTSTSGGKVNCGDASTGNTNRAMGFATSSPSWKSPTNYIMFGFTNSNPGQPVVSMNVQYNIKRYKQGSFTPTGVAFYYSVDGTNWTHLGAGDVGPYSTGSPFLFTTQPEVTNRSVTITGLNVTNGSPFYFCWQFIISGATGGPSATEHILALDDFSLSLTQGMASAASPSIWPGGAGNWSAAGNWLGSVLPVSGANLIFAGSGGASINNLNAVSTVGGGTLGSITFSNVVSGSYTLTGNAITISGGISNETSFAQTVGLPLTLTLDNNFSADSGNLIFTSSITNGGNQTIFAGNNNVTVSGSISGAGNLVMNGGGTLSLNGINTYSGVTFYNSGTMQLGNAQAIPAVSPLIVASGQTLNLNFPLAMGGLSGGGNVVMASGNCTVTANGGGVWTGNISGPSGFVMAGVGVENINSANSYTGPTTISNGIIELSGSETSISSIGTGPLVLAGGTFAWQNSRDVATGGGILPNAFVVANNSTISDLTTTTGSGSQHYLPISGSVTSSPAATLTIANIATGNFSNAVNLRLIAGGFNFVSPIIFSNASAAHPSNELCQLDSWNTIGTTQTYSAPISGPGVFRRGSDVLGGGGVTILSGSNTYAPPAGSWITHGNYLQQGLIGFGSSSVTNGSGNVMAGPIGSLDLQVSLGDPYVGFFASGGAQTIANPISLVGSVGGNNTLIIGGNNNLTLSGTLDVGASNPVVLVASNTALTTFSGPMTDGASLTNEGPGTIVFSGDNSLFTGDMTVDTGTTLVNNTTGSGTGSGAVHVNGGGTLGGNGSIGGNVNLDSGAQAYLFKTAGSSDTPLTVSGNLTLNGNAVIVDLGGSTTLGSGTYRLLNYSGALSGSFNATPAYVNGSLAGGAVGSISLGTPNQVNMVVTGGTPGNPPNFPSSSVTLLPNHNVSLTATGAIGATYKLWATTNVALTPVTNTWTLIQSGTISTSPFTLQDTNAGNFQRRFYLFSAP